MRRGRGVPVGEGRVAIRQMLRADFLLHTTPSRRNYLPVYFKTNSPWFLSVM